MIHFMHFWHTIARGQAVRHVQCENCGNEFDYTLSRKVALDAPVLPTMKQRSQKICRERLAKSLSTAIEPVSCPKCDWVQAEMAIELRRRFVKPLNTIVMIFAASCALLAIPFGFLAYQWRNVPKEAGGYSTMAAVPATACLIGIGLIILRSIIARILYPQTGFKRKSPLGESLLVVNRLAA